MASKKTSAVRKTAETPKEEAANANADSSVNSAETAQDYAIKTLPKPKFEYIELRELSLWEGNVRKTDVEADLGELEANIAANGILQPLLCQQIDGKTKVVAGGRRWRAAVKLWGKDIIGENYLVPCFIFPASADPHQISLYENTMRAPMHPIDEAEAFYKMEKVDKKSVADISHFSGKGETIVKKRIILAKNVSPSIKQLAREGKISLNQVQSFAITNDHKAQEAFIKRHGLGQRPEWIRDQLMKGKNRIPSDDERVRFVGGIKACKEAGVALVEDLFDTEAGFVEDPKALQTLLDKVAKELCDKFKAQGYAFVTFYNHDLDTTDIVKDYGYSWNDPKPKAQPMSKEDAETLKAWKAEFKGYSDRDGELNDAEETRYEQLEHMIDQLEDSYKTFPEKERAKIGVMIGVGPRGREIRFVLDKAQVKAEKTAEKAKEKKKLTPEKQEKSVEAALKKDGTDENMAGSLMSDLLAHRSFAVAAELAKRPDVALALLAAHAISEKTADGIYDLKVKFDLAYTHLNFSGEGEPEGYEALERMREEWEKKPTGKGSAFAWALAQKKETLLEILAVWTASCWNSTGGQGAWGDDEKEVAETLGVDVAKYFTPTKGNLFERIPSPYVKLAIKEARELQGKPPSECQLTPTEEGLKKAGLCDLAEREVAAAAKAGKPWLPHSLRLKKAPEKKPSTSTKATSAKKSAAKKKGGK